MPVDTLLASINSATLAEYMALEQVEGPFGDLRADMRAGIVASTVANHSMSPPKTPARPIDFMPFANKARNGPIKLANAVEQGKLIAKTIFGGLLKEPKK